MAISGSLRPLRIRSGIRNRYWKLWRIPGILNKLKSPEMELAMRYMLLVYSTEGPDGLSAEDESRIRAGHRQVIEDATRKGVLIDAQPLTPTSTATTVRTRNGKTLVMDGPFAETKEHLAGYYLLDCE